MLELAQYAGLNGWCQEVQFYINEHLDICYNDEYLFYLHNSLKHGVDIRYSDGQIVHINCWLNGKLHGIEVDYYSNNQISWVVYRLNGRPHKLHINYREDNQIAWLRYFNYGKQHGIQICYGSNNTISQLSYW